MTASVQNSAFLDSKWKAIITEVISSKKPFISKQQESEEYMLRPNPNDEILFPIPESEIDLWIMYKLQVASFWTAEEIKLAEDSRDWAALTEDEAFFLKNVFGFFATSEALVSRNLVEWFSQLIKLPAAKCFYAFQGAMESIHAEVYNLIIDVHVKDAAEKDALFHASQRNPIIRLKTDWARSWIDNQEASFAERLFAFACIEGIFFSGSFCAIFWLKKRGKFPGICFANALISRDEGLHNDFAVMLFNMLASRLSQHQAECIMRWAVAIEHEFVSNSLPVSLLGMNAIQMRDYICFVADRLMSSFGYEKIYHAENPFPWMEMLSLTGQSNFFESSTPEYSKQSVLAKTADMIVKLRARFAHYKLSAFATNFVNRNKAQEQTEQKAGEAEVDAFGTAEF